MLRPQFIFQSIVFISTTAFVSASDDVQVIRSDKSVLSIYSYGTAARTRVAPESSDSSRPTQSAPLTDVITTPPLSSSVEMPFSEPASGSGSGSSSMMVAATPAPTTTTSASVITKRPRTGTVQPTVSGPITPPPRTITFSWQPSPDAGIIGYRVYVGDARQNYTLNQSVDSQTTATVTLGDDSVYLAVTAYTAEGFESVFSDSLTVRNVNPTAVSFPAGFGGNGR